MAPSAYSGATVIFLKYKCDHAVFLFVILPRTSYVFMSPSSLMCTIIRVIIHLSLNHYCSTMFINSNPITFPKCPGLVSNVYSCSAYNTSLFCILVILNSFQFMCITHCWAFGHPLLSPLPFWPASSYFSNLSFRCQPALNFFYKGLRGIPCVYFLALLAFSHCSI